MYSGKDNIEVKIYYGVTRADVSNIDVKHTLSEYEMERFIDGKDVTPPYEIVIGATDDIDGHHTNTVNPTTAEIVPHSIDVVSTPFNHPVQLKAHTEDQPDWDVGPDGASTYVERVQATPVTIIVNHLQGIIHVFIMGIDCQQMMLIGTIRCKVPLQDKIDVTNVALFGTMAKCYITPLVIYKCKLVRFNKQHHTIVI